MSSTTRPGEEGLSQPVAGEEKEERVEEGFLENVNTPSSGEVRSSQANDAAKKQYKKRVTELEEGEKTRDEKPLQAASEMLLAASPGGQSGSKEQDEETAAELEAATPSSKRNGSARRT